MPEVTPASGTEPPVTGTDAAAAWTAGTDIAVHQPARPPPIC